MCDCKSYNNPNLSGGSTISVCLESPSWAKSQHPNGICVDACISGAISFLWKAGVITEGCCCGHNKNNPSVIIEQSQDPKAAIEVLKKDGRAWKIEQWRLETIWTANGESREELLLQEISELRLRVGKQFNENYKLFHLARKLHKVASRKDLGLSLEDLGILEEWVDFSGEKE